ncbi:hypothetical protein BV25DRAFT_1916945 [Artomyces pyxidatus]|uniref:Uncharacterized protein n=1 Tax=Artomyces pyxidatus TaxID=48021 RepID=A0ACB8SZI0_9AGAM|nr:hypothetical protein BV25DRAFT_1916945 [Artomyces pyxidatus]
MLSSDNRISYSKERLLWLSKRYLEMLRTPVSRLPPEVLERIFSFCTFLEPPSMREFSEGSYDLGWIKISHVCRSWRQISMNFAALWTDIAAPYLPERWVFEMLARSKNAPLSLMLYMSKHPPMPESPVLRHIIGPRIVPRLRHLKLDYSEAGRYGDTTIHILRQHVSAPLLESLSISGRSEYILPEDIFSSDTPSLRTLRLRQCLLPWDAPLLFHIAHLDIELSKNSVMTSDLGYIDLYQRMSFALERMSKLETLGLHNVFPMGDDGALIHLPQRLSELTLGGAPRPCIEFASHLVIPRTTHTHIFIDGSGSLNLTSLLAQFGGPSRPPRTLLIDLSLSSDFSLQLWDERRDRLSVQSHTAYFTLDVGRSTARRAPDSYHFGSLCDGLCMDELTDVFFEANLSRTWMPHRWLETFRGVGKVESLYVRGTRAAASVFYAMRVHRDFEDMSPDAVLFPSLKIFGLCDVDLEFMVEGLTGCFPFYEVLCAALDKRFLLGLPIKRLILPEEYAGSSWMKGMKELYELPDDITYDPHLEKEPRSRPLTSL